MHHLFISRIIISGFLSLLLSGCGEPNSPSVTLGAFNNSNSSNNDIDASKADSDKDGLMDNEEAACGSDKNATDTDSDLLNDMVECKTYHTNPTIPDTDGDGKSDLQEVILDHTDPLSPDNDGDGYAAVANLEGWPDEADCKDNDPTVNPGAVDAVGNLIDTNCKLDVVSAHYHFNKGYDIDVEMSPQSTGVFVTAYYADTQGNRFIPSSGVYKGETLVDPGLVDIPDTQSGPDGCKASLGCASTDYSLQPFSSDHESSSWKYCFGHTYFDSNTQSYQTVKNNANCTQPNLITSTTVAANVDQEGFGFKIKKLGTNTFKVMIVGKHSDNSNPNWEYKEVVLGE